MPKTIYSPAYEVFLRLLREARSDAGLTQRDVARRLNRPQSFVSKIEIGERRCDLLEFREFCLALGISPTEFLERLEAELRRLDAGAEDSAPG